MKKQPGFIKLIILIVAIIVILSVMGVNLRGVVESPLVQENFKYVWGYIKQGYDYTLYIWHTYLESQAITFWNWFKANNHPPVINIQSPTGV